MKVEYFTNAYIASHGHAPKGTGSWAFQICEIDGNEGEGKVIFTPPMTLTAAKAWARPYLAKEAMGYNVAAKSVLVDVLP